MHTNIYLYLLKTNRPRYCAAPVAVMMNLINIYVSTFGDAAIRKDEEMKREVAISNIGLRPNLVTRR